MMQQRKRIQTGLLLSAGALFALVLVSTAAPAQEYGDSRGMANRLTQLEKAVQTLSRSVYKGAPLPADMLSSGGAQPSQAAITLMEDRMRAMEEQQRNLVGQIEKLNFDMRQMQEQFQKAQADLDLRLQQQGSATPASTSTSTTLPADEMAATPATRSVDDAVRTSGNSTSGTLGQLSSSGAAGAEGLYESGFTDIREQKFDAAEGKFTQFMKSYPGHPLAGNAQYWLAETYYVRGDYRQAAKMFAKGYQDFPQSQKAADSLLKLGLSLGKLGKKEDACLTLQQLQKEFPGDSSPVNSRAKQEITRLGCG